MGVGSRSVTLLTLLDKALLRLALEIRWYHYKDPKNSTLSDLVQSVKGLELLKKAFEFSPIKKSSNSIELDTLPFNALKFTRAPKVEPEMKASALFGMSFSKEGPPLNKPKDKFGFDFKI